MEQLDPQNKAERNYWIVDTSRTQIWQYDHNVVYVPFDRLQADLGITAHTAQDADQWRNHQHPRPYIRDSHSREARR